jgi:acylglycerol lipase
MTESEIIKIYQITQNQYLFRSVLVKISKIRDICITKDLFKMTHQELSWQSHDNLKIFGQYWLPDAQPKAVLCLVHGMGEHSGRYQTLIDALIPHGFAVMALDHRGHGKSEGQRGHTPDFEHLLNDVQVFLRQVSNHFPHIPQILFGHSMGGCIVLNYALRRQPALKGVIASAPLLRLAFQPNALQVLLAKAVNPLLPRLTQPTRLDVNGLSRDAEVVNDYRQDKLNHDKITPRFFIEIMRAGEWALANAHTLSIPLLLYHGTADRITSHQASEQFAEKSPREFTKFKLWEGYFHELHHEIGKEQVLETLLKWIEAL